jgi:Fe-S-cluster containining protein
LNIGLKRASLHVVYGAYTEAARRFPSACRWECHACCTHNVIATTLEIDLILDHADGSGLSRLREKARRGTAGKRLHPALSINALAEHCLQRKEPPHEPEDFDMLPCPFREKDGCAMYDLRPLACRMLWSTQLCETRGEAVMPTALVSLNGVFQQIVEDLDVGGLYGNMWDLFASLNERAPREAYRAGEILPAVPPLHANRPNPGFLVPPEHRPLVTASLNALWSTMIGGLSFREARESLRHTT